MKAQDYEKIKILNQDTQKVLFEKEVIWENTWWGKATNMKNPKLEYYSNNNAYFYFNKILLKDKEKNQIYVRWNESALQNLLKLDSKMFQLGPAFYTSDNGKTGDYIAGFTESINTDNGTSKSTQTIKRSDLIKLTTLSKTELLAETYCESSVQFNFWIYNHELAKDINRINNILGLFIAVK